MGRTFYMISLHLRLYWAELRGDNLAALKLLEKITMVNLTKLSDAVDRVVAKSASDATALQAALDANTAVQPQVDELTAKLDTVAPAPAQGDSGTATE